ncbi:hypothetical protein P7K49_006921 [Saguinus oedipus]|uniref:Uncharacterized protein n=1 Tax=Saguinus oedipus TaxID=9490 RepID=A0ABQ9W4J8_SAGOE|nr:hypothetical protein P7K49_006921 [Saguinus oedipus]
MSSKSTTALIATIDTLYLSPPRSLTPFINTRPSLTESMLLHFPHQGAAVASPPLEVPSQPPTSKGATIASPLQKKLLLYPHQRRSTDAPPPLPKLLLLLPTPSGAKSHS